VHWRLQRAIGEQPSVIDAMAHAATSHLSDEPST